MGLQGCHTGLFGLAFTRSDRIESCKGCRAQCPLLQPILPGFMGILCMLEGGVLFRLCFFSAPFQLGAAELRG